MLGRAKNPTHEFKKIMALNKKKMNRIDEHAIMAQLKLHNESLENGKNS